MPWSYDWLQMNKQFGETATRPSYCIMVSGTFTECLYVTIVSDRILNQIAGWPDLVLHIYLKNKQTTG